MKVLLVQPYALGPGHYDAYTRRLCAGLCQQKVNITLLTAAGTKDGWESRLPLQHISAMNSKSPFLVTTENFRTSKIMKRLRFLLTSWEVQRRAFKLYEKGFYDILHFVDAEPITLLVSFLLSRKPRNVFLTVPSDYKIPSPPTLFYRCLYNPLRKAAARQLFRYVKPITHASKVKDSLLELELTTKKSLPVIPWGVDTPSVIREKTEARRILGIDEKQIIFGFFGYLLPQKGFDFILDIWPSVAEKYVLLVVAHADGTKMEEQIIDKIKKKGIENRVIFDFGYVSEEKLGLYIRSCDATLLPYKKTFQGESGILSQSCAYQIPVIAADVGTVGQTVQNGGIGIVFEAESSPALQNAIEKFINLKNSEINQIKENMKVFVQSRSWTEVARLHMEIYQQPIS
jgi:glycosyltransferase involved in cell wall biosynthesis